MPVQFCADCGNLLNISAAPTIACDCCGKESRNGTLSYQVNTRSNNFASPLRALQSNVKVLSQEEKQNAHKSITRDCENCSSKEFWYWELQLRSADEGSTIFYKCKQCGHRENENN